jgi:archaemetzincin
VTLIAMAAAGEVGDDVLSCAQEVLDDALGVEVRWLQPLADPAYAFDPQRRQYSSTLMLRDALSRRPANAARIVVLTSRDIFIPMLSFVYGQAQLNGPAAVVSVARLRQEYYGLPGNQQLFLLRLRKELLHEVGHTLGLIHCPDGLCTMTLSTNIHQLDLKSGQFCPNCALQVRDAVQAFHSSDSGGLS